MKKIMLSFIGVLLIIITVKYFVSDYNITYKVNDYDVREISDNNVMYYEVTYEGVVYSYLINKSRKLFKKNIKKINIEEDNGKTCLTPNDLYTVCSSGDYLVNKDNFKYIKETKDFTYNNGLNNNEYMLIWKYDGFYYMTSNEYKSINILKKDRYSNDLMIKANNYIVFPKYDDEYTFNSLIILNIQNGNYEEVNTKYSISYDSYYPGTNKNKLYLFDNKNEVLYEIDLKNSKVKKAVTGNESYFKYVSGKKVRTTINDYIDNKVTYNNEEKNIINVEDNILTYKYNDNVKYKFINESKENVRVLSVINNKIYFMYKDNIYSFYKGKINFISHYYEFNFNSLKNVFIYSE